MGGHIYFVNPRGIVVGSQGSINAGQLTAVTPTQDFVNNFFIGGVPQQTSVDALINGTAPINTKAAIVNNGVMSTIGTAVLTAGVITNTGSIVSGSPDIPSMFTLNADKMNLVGELNGYNGTANINKLSNGNIEIVRTKSPTCTALQLTPSELDTVNAKYLNIQAKDINILTNVDKMKTNNLYLMASNNVNIKGNVTVNDNFLASGVNGVFINPSTTITANNDSVYLTSSNFKISLGQGVNLNAKNDTTLVAHTDVNVGKSSIFTAGRDIIMTAGRNVTLSCYDRLTAGRNIIQTGVRAVNIGGKVTEKAGQDINLTGHCINIDKTVKLTAGGKITKTYLK